MSQFSAGGVKHDPCVFRGKTVGILHFHSLQISPNLPSVSFVLYPFTVTNDDWEYDYMLSPMSPPRKSSNLGVVLETISHIYTSCLNHISEIRFMPSGDLHFKLNMTKSTKSKNHYFTSHVFLLLCYLSHLMILITQLFEVSASPLQKARPPNPTSNYGIGSTHLSQFSGYTLPSSLAEITHSLSTIFFA